MSDDDFEVPRESGGPAATIASKAPATRAGLIVPDARGHGTGHSIEARVQEFIGLAGAIQLEVVFADAMKVRDIRPGTYVGTGHLATIKEKVEA